MAIAMALGAAHVWPMGAVRRYYGRMADFQSVFTRTLEQVKVVYREALLGSAVAERPGVSSRAGDYSRMQNHAERSSTSQ
jgi:hypothetical protein